MDRSLADATSIAEMLVFKVPALGELGGVASVLLITSASSFLSDLLTCFEQRYISALESRKNKWFYNLVLRHGEINEEQSEYVNQ